MNEIHEEVERGDVAMSSSGNNDNEKNNKNSNSSGISDTLSLSTSQNKKKRKRLTIQQKFDILNELKNNNNQSAAAVRWDVGQQTISDIVKDRVNILARFKEGDLTRKITTNVRGRYDYIDRAVILWYYHLRATQPTLGISGSFLINCAEDMCLTITNKLMNIISTSKSDVNITNAKLLLEKNKHFLASKNWMDHFKLRYNLVNKNMIGESASINLEIMEKGKEKLIEYFASKNFSTDDIYNCDETALFWSLLPNQTLAFKAEKGSPAGGRSNKARITVLFTCNASGTDLRKPLVIGKSKVPLCLKKLNMKNLLCTYKSQAKGWMDGDIFMEFILDLNEDMKRQNRKIVLIIDGAGCHRTANAYWNSEDHTSLISNIEVIFLPPNCTAKLQPLDQGIIRSVKARYKREMTLLLYNSLKNEKILPKVILLDAINMISRAWNSLKLSPQIIRNCWRKANILLEDQNTQLLQAIPILSDEIISEVTDFEKLLESEKNHTIDVLKAISHLVPDGEIPENPLELFFDFLDAESGEPTSQIHTEESVACHIIEEENVNLVDGKSEEDVEENYVHIVSNYPPMTLHEIQNLTSKLIHELQLQQRQYTTEIDNLYKLQNNLETFELSRPTVSSSITDYFHKK